MSNERQSASRPDRSRRDDLDTGDPGLNWLLAHKGETARTLLDTARRHAAAVDALTLARSRRGTHAHQTIEDAIGREGSAWTSFNDAWTAALREGWAPRELAEIGVNPPPPRRRRRT